MRLTIQEILLGFVCILLAIVGPTPVSQYVLVTSLLALNIYVLTRTLYKGAYALSIFSFFLLSYSYIPFAHYVFDLRINIRTFVYSPDTVYQTGVLCLIFLSVFFKFVIIRRDSEYPWLSSPQRRGVSMVVYTLLLLSFVFTTWGLQGQTILEVGGYKESLASRESSVLFAYTLLTLPLAFLYTHTRTQRMLCYIMLLYYCSKIMLFGGRIEAIQMSITFFLIRFRFTWSRLRMIYMVLGAYILMTVWSVYRASTTVAITSITPDKLYISGGDVYYASMRIIYFIEHEILSLSDRIEAFLYYIVSALLPYRWLPDLANLSSYLKHKYDTGGGGLAPIFFYAFGGYPLVILAGYTLATLVNKMNNSRYHYFYGILLIATVPRWYAYYPIQPIKICLLGIILLWGIEYYLSNKNSIEHLKKL